MQRIAMLFPYAPAYREPIYQLMDNELEVDWFFAGNANRPLKMFNYGCLKNCNLSLQEKKLVGNITYYKGIKSLTLEKYDVIIIAGVLRCISEWLLLWKFKNNTKARVYIWTHGWYGKESWLTSILKKGFYSMAKGGILLYGNYARELMIKKGFQKDKLFTIHNSLNYDKQFEIRQNLIPTPIYKEHFGNDNYNLLFIGRLTMVKRLDMILKAVTACKQEGVKFNVIFVGDGERKEELKLLANQLGIERQTWFYGACYDEFKNAQLIYNADLCVSPGNVGLTAMHSLVYGTPVITHNDFKWQMPEFEAIHPGETGDFYNKGDLNSLKDVIKKWVIEHTDRESIRKKCYKEIDEQWTPRFQLKVLKNAIGNF